MKKFKLFAMLLAVLMVASGVCLAAGFDLESIKLIDASTEDLLRLKDFIDDELASRGFYENEILETGFYVVGKDIVPGKFDLQAIPGAEWASYITVYADASAKKDRQVLYEVSLSYGDTSMILEEGNLVQVQFNACVCKLNDTKKSWAP